MSRSFGQTVLATCLGGVALALASLPAAAEGGTAQERMACMSDAMTYCSSAIPDEGRIEVCLRRQGTRISTACRTVLGPASSSDVASTGSTTHAATH